MSDDCPTTIDDVFGPDDDPRLPRPVVSWDYDPWLKRMRLTDVAFEHPDDPT